MEEKTYVCKWDGALLCATERQSHSDPDFAEFKTCPKCKYQWAKKYWDSDCVPVKEGC